MPFVIGAVPPLGLQPGGLAVVEGRCDPPRSDLALRALEALPRDIGHGALIAHAGEVTRALRFQGGRPERVRLVVDATSLGEATQRLWCASGLGAVLVEVTTKRGDAGDGIARLDLAALLQAVLEQQRFRWSKQLAEAGLFQRQLDGFRLRPVRRDGTDLEAAREDVGEHLVLAAALAAWWGERMRPEDGAVHVAETRWSVLAP
jgi:hypothetical protein